MSVRAWVAAIVGALGAASAGPALAGFSGSDVFLPMAGRQAGVHPSNWYTTVWVHNPGAEAATARVYFLERGTANPSPPAVDVLVAPGATEKLENVVEAYFHAQGFGALRITCATQKLVVTSRVYSKALGAGEADSVGQDFAGVPASFAIGLGERSQILGAHQTQPSAGSEYRYNFGVVETTGHSAWVRVRALDALGTEAGRTEFQVREWSQRQVAFKDHFPSVSTENNRLEVEVISGSGKVIAYGSGIANGSQDPTTFEMTYADALLGISTVQHDATLVGDGTAAAPLGLADGAVGKTKVAAVGGTAGQVLGTDGTALQWVSVGAGDITAVGTAAGSGLTGGVASGEANLAIAPGGVSEAMLGPASVSLAKVKASFPGAEKVLGNNGTDLKWQDDGLTLPYSRDVATAGWAFNVVNSAGSSIRGESASSLGVLGASGGIPPGPIFPAAAVGVGAVSQAGFGVYALGEALGGVFGGSTAGHGVFGYSVNAFGVKGVSSGAFSGSMPASQAGVVGTSQQDIGVLGVSTDGAGVLGSSVDDVGVRGQSMDDMGVIGNSSESWEVFGFGGGGGVWGDSISGFGVKGTSWASSEAAGAFIHSRVGVAALYARGASDPSPDIELGANSVGEDDGTIYSSSVYPGSDIGLHSNDRVWIDLDDDNNSSGSFFQVRSGSDSTIFLVEEDGDVRVPHLGGGGTRDLCIDTNGFLAWCPAVPSDARLKTDVVPLADEIDVLAGLAMLTGVRYFWDTTQPRAAELGVRREVGLLAQDVETVLPEVVSYDSDGYRSLDYARLTAFLVEVAKAQQGLIDTQAAAIRELVTRVAALEAGAAPAPQRPAEGNGR